MIFTRTIMNECFLLLFFFSPPLYIFDFQIAQSTMTAEIEIYCIESATQVILKQLQYSLANQGATPMFGTTILQAQYPG